MGSARLRAANPNDLVLPVQIVQPQAGHFSGPQPVGDKQHEDRAVALVDWAIPLNRGQQTQDILAPDALRHGLVCHEPGRHDPGGQTRPAPVARFGEEEERPQSLRVIVCRPPVPGSSLVLCRNGIIDVGDLDGDQWKAVSCQPDEEVVGGAAIALDGRIREAPLSVQPVLKDRDLCVMRTVLMFGFVEPIQKAQPLDTATDKACSRLG